MTKIAKSELIAIKVTLDLSTKLFGEAAHFVLQVRSQLWITISTGRTSTSTRGILHTPRSTHTLT